MAIGVIWYPPIDSESYEAIRKQVLQASIDNGQRFHAAGPTDDGRWCIIELWESRDGLKRFIRDDLGPAFEPIGPAGGDPPQPALVFDVHQYDQS
jgi:hypothetical protein